MFCFYDFLWIYPGIIGFTVGMSELLNRYKTFERIFNWYSILYMMINFSASVLVYFIFKIYKVDLGGIGSHSLGLILLSGISAMGFLRSSFFNYKTSNDKVIEVGPATILNIFLNAAQRQFDQALSQYNLNRLKETMKDVNFISASKDLPIIILSSMRVLTSDEQKEFSDDVLKLVNDTNTTVEVKNIALGIVCLKYTGMELLEGAIDTLKDIYNNKIQKSLDRINQLQQDISKIVK